MHGQNHIKFQNIHIYC